jgi:hypothetical protein
LHENCLCPVQGIFLPNAVGISHVDSHALSAFAANWTRRMRSPLEALAWPTWV